MKNYILTNKEKKQMQHFVEIAVNCGFYGHLKKTFEDMKRGDIKEYSKFLEGITDQLIRTHGAIGLLNDIKNFYERNLRTSGQ